MNKYLSLLCILLISCSCTSATSEKDNKHLRLKLQWSFEFIDDVYPNSSIKNMPMIIDENSILLDYDSGLTKLDINDGKLYWHTPAISEYGINVRNLCVDNHNVYVKVNRSNKLQAYNLTDGSLSWEQVSDFDFFDFNNDYINNGKLYLTDDKYSMSIYDTTGTFVKRIMLPDSYARSIFVEGDRIYISQGWGNASQGENGQILCYSEQTEELLWSYKTDTGGFYYAKLYENEDLLLSGTLFDRGEVVALDKETGEVKWRKLGYNTYRMCISDKAVFGNDGIGVYALDIQSGKKLWYYAPLGNGHAESNVAYANGRVYHAHSGTLYVLDAETGEVLDRVLTSPDGTGFYNVTAQGNRVYAQSDWFIYAYEMQ